MKTDLPRFLREPLFHFFVLGLAVLAVDRYVLVNTDDPSRVEIDDQRFEELASIFEEGQGRPPDQAEMEALMIKWAQNEILYREARSMGLDRGDEMIRQRLILKLRDILFGNITVTAPDEPSLEAWFQENRSAYDRPDLYDFEQFLIGNDAAAAAALAADLGTADVPDDYASSYRRYPRRPAANLSAVFGDDGGKRLLAAERTNWVAVESDYGWHLARITGVLAGQAAVFDNIRGTVAQDWQDQERKKELAAALGAIVDQYQVSYDIETATVRENLDLKTTLSQAGAR